MSAINQPESKYIDAGSIHRKCAGLTYYMMIPYDCSCWWTSHTFGGINI